MRTSVIVRMSEAAVQPGRLGEFLEAVLREVQPYAREHKGLLSDEILVQDGPEPVLIYVSRWRDEAAVRAFAGPDWRDEAVTFPGEGDYLRGPLRVRHFRATPARGPASVATADQR